MKPSPGERLRRLWLRRRDPRGERKRGGQRDREEREVIEEIAAEFSTQELQEFLEADRNPAPADPVFKEQLREKLWKLLEEQRTEGSPTEGSGTDRDH